jgi:hypothetical protein
MERFMLGIKGWMRAERGFGEVFSTLFILPFIVASIFVLVEIGFNMRYRIAVDDIVNDTVRAASTDGTAGIPPAWSTLYPSAASRCLELATPNPPTPPPPNAPPRTRLCSSYATQLNNPITWQNIGTQRLRSLCGATRCTSTANARMTCTPAHTDALPYTTSWVPPNAGLIVRCTGVFPYKNIASFTVSNQVFNLGFGTFWSDPIVFTAESMTMVGSGE